MFGNRVQQPHLQGVSKSSEDDDDDDSKDLRPEDLLSLEEEDMDDSDDDLEEVVVPKEEPIDIDDDMDESATEWVYLWTAILVIGFFLFWFFLLVWLTM